MSLGRSVIFGASVGWGGALLGFAVRFAANAVLARFISPTTFGAFALAFVYVEFLGIALAFNFSQALVQFDDPLEHLLPATLQLNTLSAGAIMLMSLAAYPVALYFDSPEVAMLVVALGAARCASVYAGTYDALLQKDLRFGRLAALRFAGVVVGSLTAVLVGWCKLPLAALVARESLPILVGVIPFLATVPLFGSGPINASAEIKACRQRVLVLGKSLFWQRTLDIIYYRADQFLLARLLSPIDLGYYHQARYLAGLPQAAIAPATQSVALRLFAGVRHDQEKLRRAAELLQACVGHGMVLGSLVLVFAPATLIRLILGEQWLPVAPLLPYLAAWVLFQQLVQNMQTLLTALELWRPIRAAQSAQIATLCLLGVPLAIQMGARGAALALTASVLSALLTLRTAVPEEARPRPAVYRGLTFGTALLALLAVFSDSVPASDVAGAAIKCGVIAVVYLVVVVVLDGQHLREMYVLVARQILRRPHTSG